MASISNFTSSFEEKQILPVENLFFGCVFRINLFTPPARALGFARGRFSLSVRL
jgi:hypothetical protein